MKILHVTVGLPRSGKTTWALKTNDPIVNPDSVRLALHGMRFLNDAEPMVWTMTLYMVKALFLAGHSDVVLDATNIKQSRRDMWIRTEWTTWFIVFPADKELCIERARKIDDLAIIPVIERMALEFEPMDAE